MACDACKASKELFACGARTDFEVGMHAMNEKLDGIRFSRPSDFADFAEKETRIYRVRHWCVVVHTLLRLRLLEICSKGTVVVCFWMWDSISREIGAQTTTEKQSKETRQGWGGWRRVALACFFSHL